MSEVTKFDDVDLESLMTGDPSGQPEVIVEERGAETADVSDEHQKYVVAEGNSEDTVASNGKLSAASLEGIEQTLRTLDELTEKAKRVSINVNPEEKGAVAEAVDALSGVSLEDIEAAEKSAEAGSILEANGGTATGLDVDADTSLDNTRSLGGGKIVLKGSGGEETAAPKRTEDPNFDKEEAIQVIIDKTGLGAESIDFTEAERGKLYNCTRIDIVEVEKQELGTMKVVTDPNPGFFERVKHDLVNVLGNACTMPLVASRYRASFRSLPYGEYANLGLNTNITDTDQLRARLTAYYRAIVSTSIGNFESFDDFLKHTAMTDLPMMTLGIYVATNPELMEVAIECRREGCGKHFGWKFVPRTLLDLTRSSERFLELMEKVATVELGEKALELHKGSSVITRTRIKLPVCGIICDIGMVSCYDMLYSRTPFIKEAETMLAERYPDDVANIHALVPVLAEIVCGIIVNDEHGNPTYVTDLVTISDILYSCPTSDFQILRAISAQASEDYNYKFTARNVKCPGCGTVTSAVEIDLDDEVFQQLRVLANTHINKETLPKL